MPPSPQRYPVQIQAGDSDGGRELAARYADVIFSRHSDYEGGRAFYTDVKRRLGTYGRDADDLKIIPAATAVLGDSRSDAEERLHHIQRQQVSPQGAIAFLEQVWGRDLSALDPDGPLPAEDPDVDGIGSITRGRVRHTNDPVAVARAWRARAEAKGLSIRELIIDVTARTSFVGTPTPGSRGDQPARAGRRRGRLHPRAAPHASRARRVHRQGRARAPGPRRVPRRLRARHAAAAISAWPPSADPSDQTGLGRVDAEARVDREMPGQGSGVYPAASVLSAI